MNNNNVVNNVLNNQIEANNISTDNSNLSLESLTLLINAERLKTLEGKITNGLLDIKSNQEQVAFLHKLIKAINTATVNGEFDCTDNADLKKLFKKAKDYGVDIQANKFKFNKDERELLIENIRMTADDINVLVDMKQQEVSRLITERYEAWQLARSVLKPLHEDKTDKSRAMAGR